MNARQVLLQLGITLILLGLIGLIGLLGPTAGDSLFGARWWLDPGQNWAHLLVGLIAVLSALLVHQLVQRYLAILLGIAALCLSVVSLFNPDLWAIHLERPVETVLYALLGIWILVCAES